MPRKPEKLLTDYPKLISQWHPTKNGDIDPNKIAHRSKFRAWWQCPENQNHVYDATVANRTYGTQCPFCSGYRLCDSKRLTKTHPELCKEWHPTKNRDLKPDQVSAGSSCRKVWWQCPVGDDHVYQTTVAERTKGSGCPYCCNQKVCISNCLATTHPHIAKEWHPTKNGDKTPKDVVSGSQIKVWWQCEKGHEWSSTPCSRTSVFIPRLRGGCPCCCNRRICKDNCLATTHPEMAKEWHPTKNGTITTHDVMAGTLKKYWWQCLVDSSHEWKTAPNSRSPGTGCPFCREFRGEKNIVSYLENCNLTFKRQITFDGCKFKKVLRFDFGVWINGRLVLLEYQGQQHYEPVKFHNAHYNYIESFKLNKLKDKIKKDYCNANQIPLLEIPYWEIDNIPMILDDFFKTVDVD